MASKDQCNIYYNLAAWGQHHVDIPKGKVAAQGNHKTAFLYVRSIHPIHPPPHPPPQEGTDLLSCPIRSLLTTHPPTHPPLSSHLLTCVGLSVIDGVMRLVTDMHEEEEAEEARELLQRAQAEEEEEAEGRGRGGEEEEEEEGAIRKLVQSNPHLAGSSSMHASLKGGVGEYQGGGGKEGGGGGGKERRVGGRGKGGGRPQPPPASTPSTGAGGGKKKQQKKKGGQQPSSSNSIIPPHVRAIAAAASDSFNPGDNVREHSKRKFNYGTTVRVQTTLNEYLTESLLEFMVWCGSFTTCV